MFVAYLPIIAFVIMPIIALGGIYMLRMYMIYKDVHIDNRVHTEM